MNTDSILIPLKLSVNGEKLQQQLVDALEMYFKRDTREELKPVEFMVHGLGKYTIETLKPDDVITEKHLKVTFEKDNEVINTITVMKNSVETMGRVSNVYFARVRGEFVVKRQQLPKHKLEDYDNQFVLEFTKNMVSFREVAHMKMMVALSKVVKILGKKPEQGKE